MMVTSIRATKIRPAVGGEKVPCRRCGIERTRKPGDTGYCTSCVSVLRYDADYFNNRPDRDELQARFRHHTQKAS